jgi:hypothetical protein
MAEMTLEQLAVRRAELRGELADVFELLRVAALEKLAGGSNESEVARDAGVDRMTVRKWQGKR